MSHIKHVRLVWVVRSYPEASLFDEALHSMQSASASSSSASKKAQQSTSHPRPDFSYALHVTNSRPTDSEQSRLESGTKMSPPPRKSSGSTSSKRDKASQAHTGRPELQSEIFALAPWGLEAVVFACGPASLIGACADLARKAKVDFRSESFEL